MKTSLLFVGLLAVASADNVRKLAKPVYFKDAQDGKVQDQEDGTGGGRVIGGTAVQPGDLPFYGHFEGDVMCGGFLAAEDVFVTAAHCLEQGFPGSIRIGATQTVSQNEGQSVPVCSAIIHPANNMKSMENDIAILKLCDPVFVNSYGEYNRNPDYPGATGVDIFMVGFGRTNVAGGLSPILQKAKVDYLDNGACAARYSKYNGDQTLCADSPTNGICYGDSGGPALDTNNLVVGLNSYIVDTCASSYPDFFTRISSYSNWLDEMICTQAMSPPEWCDDVSTGSSSSGGSNGGGSGGDGGGRPSQGSQDNDSESDSVLTECLTLMIGLIRSILG